MKKVKSIFAVVAMVALLTASACTRRYTCPTYLKNDGKTEIKPTNC